VTKLRTIPQIQRAFNDHLRECGECRSAIEEPQFRQLCVTGQMLSTMLMNKLKGDIRS
jgi:hypothetical protein